MPPTPVRLADTMRTDPPHRFAGGGKERGARPYRHLPMNSASVFTVSRLASSEPTVMRRQFGNL